MNYTFINISIISFSTIGFKTTYITIILRGGYWETLVSGKYWRPPGYIGFRSADHLHRVDLKPNTSTMTLFIPGPFGLRKNKRASYKQKIKGDSND